MIRRMLRPVLRALPPLSTIVLFLFCYGFVQGAAVFSRMAYGEIDPAMAAVVLKPFAIFDTLTATVGAVLFALWRVYALHPIVNWEYRQWLERMPWTSGRPLPMGSVVPGMFDIVALALLCWMAGHAWPFSPLAPILGYLVASTIAGCVIIGFTRQRVVFYSLLFGMGLALRLATNPLWPLTVLAITFPLVLVGLRRSLEPICWPSFALSLRSLSENKKQAPKELGWPFGFLGPKAAPRLIRWPNTLAIALLSGWFLYAILSHIPSMPVQDRALAQVFSAGLALLAIGRAFGYFLIYAAPISPFGRLLTGRWIIPGYDRVFLASLYTGLAIAVAESLIVHFAVPTALGQPVVVALCVFLLLAVGPTYRNWQLTGAHRINSSSVCNKAGPYVEV